MIPGVYDEYLLEPLVNVLFDTGVKNGMVYLRPGLPRRALAECPDSVCEFKDGSTLHGEARGLRLHALHEG